MKVSHITTDGIAGVPDLDIDLLAGRGSPSDLTFVEGPPASGKTRLLEAILAAFEFVGPYEGMVRASEWVRDPALGGRIEIGLWMNDTEVREAKPATNPTRVVVHLEPSQRGQTQSARGAHFEVERATSRLLQRYVHDDNAGKREYFSEQRQLSWGSFADGTGALEQSLVRCGKSAHKYSFLPRFLASLFSDSYARERFARSLSGLAPQLRFEPNEGTEQFSSFGGALAPPAGLSSSECDAILIAATASMIRLSNSVVLLDRPELYVPPSRIVDWVQALSKLGTQNQWIIATRSPELLRSSQQAQVISLKPSERGAPR